MATTACSRTRAVPALAAGATSSGTVNVTVPSVAETDGKIKLHFTYCARCRRLG